MIGQVFSYAYVQARTRTLKSRLLDHDDWHYLVRMRRLDDILRYLSATNYGHFLPLTSIDRNDIRSISLSLHDALFADYLKLIAALPRCRVTILYGLAARYDAENIKTLLRGIWKISPESSIRPLIYRMGRLSRLPLDTMLHIRNIPEAVDSLKKTVFHAPLMHALPRFQAQDRLFPLEMAADMAAFHLLSDRIGRLQGVDRQHASRLTGAFVDGITLSWIVRFRWSYGLSPEEIINYFLPHGRLITLHDMGNLARASDLPTFLNALPPPYRRQLENVQRWDQIQTYFQTWQVSELYRLFRRNPFHIGLPISYLLLKEWEVKALDGLISAVEAGQTVDGILNIWQGGWLHTSRNARTGNPLKGRTDVQK
jgi:V/A-type H+-transporting ATPase subunit C